MPTTNSKILEDDVIPKPVRVEEPAVPCSEVKTKLPSLLPVITLVLALAAICAAQNPPSPAQETRDNIPFLTPLPQDTGLPGLKQILRKLQTTGRLMMVVAHPDDEDGGTLTLEARGKGVQTLLFTLTRGEGGQNELGTGLFDKLGILRTLELLASDKYYGVEQRFSRAADFGYSKTPEETFQKWGGYDVPLGDMVRVIRTFRPDVLVARFSGTDADGHGHHQASAILTREAFRAAADPSRFPEQIKEGLQPWQAKKLYMGNVCGFRSNTCADENWTVKLDAGEVDPVLGMSYAQMAAEGLAHQRSQGHGEYKVAPGAHNSFYKLVDSVLPNTKDAIGHEKDFFDGIDTSLPGLADRVHGGLLDSGFARIWRRILVAAQSKIGEATASQQDPVAAVAPLLEAKSMLGKAMLGVFGNRVLPTGGESPSFQTDTGELLDALKKEASELQRAIGLAAGVDLQLTAERSVIQHSEAALTPGGTFEITARFTSSAKPKVGVRDFTLDLPKTWKSKKLKSERNSPQSTFETFRVTVPADAQYDRPYWHRANPEVDGVNTVDDTLDAGLPFSPPLVWARADYTVGSQAESIDAPGILKYKESDGREVEQSFAIVPAVSVALEPGEQVLPVADGKETAVKVGISSNLTGAPAGTLHLDLPAGWRAEPDSLKVSLPKRGDQQDFTFKVFPANLKEGRSEIRAVVDAGGTKYAEGYTLVTREDLDSAYYFQPAVQHVSIVDVKIPKDLKVGYILGAGDDIPTVLQQIGMNVTLIPAEKLATDNLSQYNTIVLGVRAYDAQKDVVANSQKLLDYVFNGGTLVVQHNNDTGAFNSAHFTPYPATLSRTRVSVEEAPVTMLAPDNSVFHYPNEISQKDFDGWVQERGLYFMDKWDDHFTPLMSCHDPNEPDAKGGLLYAKYGKGVYIYSGYSFYRQLPAGVSGAIRLFVNMVSAASSR
jgi:LmbE family N-acetylglucosaminyl deacetylase